MVLFCGYTLHAAIFVGSQAVYRSRWFSKLAFKLSKSCVCQFGDVCLQMESHVVRDHNSPAPEQKLDMGDPSIFLM